MMTLTRHRLRNPALPATQPAHDEIAMNARAAADTQAIEDTLPWSASSIDELPPAIPLFDPVAQLLLEERNESTLTRLVLCAALSVALLALAGGLLS
jgi:hypothetical protein